MNERKRTDSNLKADNGSSDGGRQKNPLNCLITAPLVILTFFGVLYGVSYLCVILPQVVRDVIGSMLVALVIVSLIEG